MTTLLSLRSKVAQFLFSDTQSAPIWLIVRLYVGWQWLSAGWEKITNPAWFGSGAGTALEGFVKGALAKTGGAHPDVQAWYGAFLQGVILPHPVVWSHLISLGETLVGLGLIVGLLTGTAAFFGALMNLDYLLAGAVSINPILLVLAFALMLGHRVAGWWGLDGVVRHFRQRATPHEQPQRPPPRPATPAQ
jgi:thiosulfate dehydrogenase [quinone] large subunit